RGDRPGRQESAADERRRRQSQGTFRRRLGGSLHIVRVRPVGLCCRHGRRHPAAEGPDHAISSQSRCQRFHVQAVARPLPDRAQQAVLRGAVCHCLRVDRAGCRRRCQIPQGGPHPSADHRHRHLPRHPVARLLRRGRIQEHAGFRLSDVCDPDIGIPGLGAVHPRPKDHGTAHALDRRLHFARAPRSPSRSRVEGASHRRPRPPTGSRMMGWTLGRYFFFRYATITLWFFLGIFALVFLIDFTELTGQTARLPGFTYQTGVMISAFRVPMIMLQTVPFIGLFSAMAMLVSLNRKYELVIARSAGISAWQFLLPACLGALLFGVLSVGVLNPIAAYGFSYSEQLESQLRSGASNAISANSAPWIRQKTESGDTIIGAHAILNQGLEMADASFFILDSQGNIVERKDAKHVYLRDGYWDLRDVRIFRKGHAAESKAEDRVATNLKPEF